MALPPGVTKEDVDAALARERALAEKRKRDIHDLYHQPAPVTIEPAPAAPVAPATPVPPPITPMDMERIRKLREQQLEQQLIQDYEKRNPAKGKTLYDMREGWMKNSQ